MKTSLKKCNAYITTPIYYVNAKAHIGHAYTTIIADLLARYSRMRGLETFFLTGTDEHGQKIQTAALNLNRPTKEYADEISNGFKNLWEDFDITFDKFIRTTDKEHKIGVQKAFNYMLAKGDIYKDYYEGYYCIPCESFFTSSQLVNEFFCPDCKRKTSIVKEESYFFRLSKYEDRLLQWYNENEECILPKSRKNEILKFVENKLKDLSITRTSFNWGVKLPDNLDEPKHVVYVWLDALMNYITALGYGKDDANISKFWPANVHLVGKDILRFHAIFWPAFLMSLDLPLPKHIAAHGWWTINGEKMSKSKGNVIDPQEIANAYGLDNLRYFLLREVPFGQDGDFSQQALINRINGDLANDLGNLLNRIIGMSYKYSQGIINSCDIVKYHQKELDQAQEIIDKLEDYIFNMQIHLYLQDIWKILSIANKSIDLYAPWIKAKQEQTLDQALAVSALVANLLAKVSLLLYPVMPSTTQIIANSLGFEITSQSYKSLIIDQKNLETFTIKKIKPLFPHVEKPLLKKTSQTLTKVVDTCKEKSLSKDSSSMITIDEFFKTSIKVGTIIEVIDIPKSKKLYKLLVDVGQTNARQIIAGIKAYYEPKELLNKQICVVTNLKPTKIMGLLSEGMLLAAKDDNGLCLIKPEKFSTVGTSIG